MMALIALYVFAGLAFLTICVGSGIGIAVIARRAGMRAAEGNYEVSSLQTEIDTQVLLLTREIARVEHKLNNVRAISDAYDLRIQRLEGSKRAS